MKLKRKDYQKPSFEVNFPDTLEYKRLMALMEEEHSSNKKEEICQGKIGTHIKNKCQ